jgi:hypothetical protein
VLIAEITVAVRSATTGMVATGGNKNVEFKFLLVRKCDMCAP